MPDYPGTFIVLEGVDGSGKTTQFHLLAERLKAVGYDVEVFDFPRYDESSSYFVKRYLNGDYGPANEISPYSASLFYALDRFEAAPAIRQALDSGKVVLSNRYAGSNMAHQGSKFTNEAEQRGFFIWADSLEYQLLGIPRPTTNVFLRVAAEISFELISKKSARSYTNKKHDEHEADIDHLRGSVAAYDNLCRLFPRDFQAVECVQDGRIMSIAAINDRIWEITRPLLPPKPQNSARATVVKFNSKVTKTTIKAQPAKNLKKNPKSQGPGQETEKTKLSLASLLEAAKAGADVRGLSAAANLGTDYYIPKALDSKTSARYRQTMEQLIKRRQHIQRTLLKNTSASGNEATAYATARLVMPMAAYLQLDSAMARTTVKYAELDQKPPSSGVVEEMARQQLSANLGAELAPLSLLEAWPRNEFDMLSDRLYALSDTPKQQVQLEVESWTYDQKHEALLKILKSSDFSTGQQLRYNWDVITDQSLLLELLRLGLSANLQIQSSTARYGYEIPSQIEQAGLEEEFISSFDLSLELFSQLQAADHEQLAPYATLLGHKVRFQLTTDFKAFTSLDSANSPALKAFRAGLVEKITEKHPLIATYLSPPPNTNRAHRKSRYRRRSK